MIRKAETLAMTVLLVALYCTRGLGQVPPVTILEIDVENLVNYASDVNDVSRYTTDPNVTTENPARNLGTVFQVSDIVAVNGKPAKGTHVLQGRTINLRTAPTPGQAIADTARNIIFDQTWEILKPDGTPIGFIISSGLGGGTVPPGAPSAVLQGGNAAIVGGAGAFLGARGQTGVGGLAGPVIGSRNASVTEDPANRRRNGGGVRRFILHVIPLSRPEVVITPGGPAVTHSDFTLVSASRPAGVGEILSAFVTGLGPTRPGVDPGKPFPATPLAVANSPVEVLVNGRPAEVTAAVGFPGAVDGYQVNFRVPSDTARGTATIQVTAAWIAGPEVRIPVQ